MRTFNYISFLSTSIRFLSFIAQKATLLVTSGARRGEQVLRGLVEKSEYERPGTALHDMTRPRDTFDERISLQPRVRLTNGLPWWVATSLLQ